MLADSLAAWAGERGYRFNEHDGEPLARSMESWQPFPDTVPALRAARDAGLRLWILSNTDRAIIEHSLRHLEVEFDGVTVAEDCRAYKPSTRAVRARPARDRRAAASRSCTWRSASSTTSARRSSWGCARRG